MTNPTPIALAEIKRVPFERKGEAVLPKSANSKEDYEKLAMEFSYHPETGNFIRLRYASFRARAGALCTAKDAHGYVIITFRNLRVKAHRLAWFIMTETIPKETVDHINGDRSDNRFSNLRCASKSLNCHNQISPTRNSTGLRGVTKLKGCNERYSASVSHKGVKKHIGCFSSAALAHQAYLKEKQKIMEKEIKACT